MNHGWQSESTGRKVFGASGYVFVYLSMVTVRFGSVRFQFSVHTVRFGS